MANEDTATCSDCGATLTAPSNSSKWRGWRVLTEYKGQYPPKGYRCPACHKAHKAQGKAGRAV